MIAVIEITCSEKQSLEMMQALDTGLLSAGRCTIPSTFWQDLPSDLILAPTFISPRSTRIWHQSAPRMNSLPLSVAKALSFIRSLFAISLIWVELGCSTALGEDLAEKKNSGSVNGLPATLSLFYFGGSEDGVLGILKCGSKSFMLAGEESRPGIKGPNPVLFLSVVYKGRTVAYIRAKWDYGTKDSTGGYRGSMLIEKDKSVVPVEFH